MTLKEDWLILRHGTMDESIARSIIIHNEYNLPAKFDQEDVIVDVGAHIGAFAYACVSRGAGLVVAIEPVWENFALLEANMSVFAAHVKLIHGALWRSDAPKKVTLRYDGFPRGEGDVNTGGIAVWSGTGRRSVKAIPFDRLVDDLCGQGGREIRLLKLDCEGSEWPILMTSRRLQRVREICGEFHEIGGAFNNARFPEEIAGRSTFTQASLVEFLEASGFCVTSERSNDRVGKPTNLGHFSARRR